MYNPNTPRVTLNGFRSPVDFISFVINLEIFPSGLSLLSGCAALTSITESAMLSWYNEYLRGEYKTTGHFTLHSSIKNSLLSSFSL